MLRLINKNRIYYYIFSFLFLSTITNYNFSNYLKKNFLIRNIETNVKTNEIKNIILKNTKFLIDKNIFLLSKIDLLKKFKNLNYLEDISIKKHYPSTIVIEAKKTKLVATTFINQKKFFVGLNEQFISSEKISSKEKLPLIFGKFNIYDFISLKKKLENHQIDYNQILNFYFHKSERWDLHFDNDVILMLPKNNVDKALRLFKQLSRELYIKSKTVIDLRVENRLIIKNEE